MAMTMDEDALMAAADLIGRTGAKGFAVGYLHDDVPVEKADWYAHAQYQGARVITEHHRSPVEASEALARQLLEGGICQRCGGLIGLTDAGVYIQPGARMLDGSEMTPERARKMRQCHWRRLGRRWTPGCEIRPAGPTRQQRRAAERASRKQR